MWVNLGGVLVRCVLDVLLVRSEVLSRAWHQQTDGLVPGVLTRWPEGWGSVIDQASSRWLETGCCQSVMLATWSVVTRAGAVGDCQ